MLAIAILLPAECLLAPGNGLAQRHDDLLPATPHVDLDRAAALRRLDAMVDGVLDQRLEHERRDQRVRRHPVDLPDHAQPVTQAQLSSARYWRASSTSLAIGASVRLSAISTRKRSARSSERARRGAAPSASATAPR